MWPIDFGRSGSRLVGAFDRAATRGFYTVKVQGGRSDQPKQATLTFAVNLAPEESDPAIIEEPGFKEMLPGKLYFVDATAEAQQQRTSDDQVEIFRWLIYLLFLIIGVEFLFATLGGGTKKDTEEESRTVTERIKDIGAGSWVARMTGAEKGRE
jgi:hypothetical protein